jgi:hypothetical protein
MSKSQNYMPNAHSAPKIIIPQMLLLLFKTLNFFSWTNSMSNSSQDK